MCSLCRIFDEIKPRSSIPPERTLIKATRSMERPSIDFKGPVPSVKNNTYLLVVIDEYSQFPCPNMHTTTILKALGQLLWLECPATHTQTEVRPS